MDMYGDSLWVTAAVILILWYEIYVSYNFISKALFKNNTYMEPYIVDLNTYMYI